MQPVKAKDVEQIISPSQQTSIDTSAGDSDQRTEIMVMTVRAPKDPAKTKPLFSFSASKTAIKKVLSPSSEKSMSRNPETMPSRKGLSPISPALSTSDSAGRHRVLLDCCRPMPDHLWLPGMKAAVLSATGATVDVTAFVTDSGTAPATKLATLSATTACATPAAKRLTEAAVTVHPKARSAACRGVCSSGGR